MPQGWLGSLWGETQWIVFQLLTLVIQKISHPQVWPECCNCVILTQYSGVWLQWASWRFSGTSDGVLVLPSLISNEGYIMHLDIFYSNYPVFGNYIPWDFIILFDHHDVWYRFHPPWIICYLNQFPLNKLIFKILYRFFCGFYQLRSWTVWFLSHTYSWCRHWC